jgi:hypothetical protein
LFDLPDGRSIQHQVLGDALETHTDMFDVMLAGRSRLDHGDSGLFRNAGKATDLIIFDETGNSFIAPSSLKRLCHENPNIE